MDGKVFLHELSNLLGDTRDRVMWNEYFMSIALLSSQRSACERLKVGCVIVNNNRIVCMGYNGFLPGGPHVSKIRDAHEQATVHAEQNAIADAAARGVSAKNSIAYITHFPCINCFKILAASQIKKIFYYGDYKNDDFVNEMAIENNVEIIKI